MEIKHYLKAIFKRLWIVVLVPLIAAGTSAVLSLEVLEPVYEADTTLYIFKRAEDPQQFIDYNDIMTNQQLVNDYREIVRSRLVTGTVISELGLKDYDTEKLSDKINITSRNDTRIMEISIQDKSPALARDLANKVREVFIKKITELSKLENIYTIDVAELPGRPVKPNLPVNCIVSFSAGLFLAICLALLIEYMDDTIKSPEDIEKYTGLPVLGIIPVLDTGAS